MRLSQITDLPVSHDVEISGITADSRMARRGALYAALPGTRTNGADFVADAVAHGAVAVLAAEGDTIAARGEAVVLRSPNPRAELARMAARFYGRQPETIVAVTGTSGKTSTAYFTQQLWELSGVAKAASLGTLGLSSGGTIRKGSLTTPDTVSLHAELADLASAGVTHLAMEASSHGLDQHRLDGVRINAAAYTNLSRDHLDYHTTMDEYFAAKARLFSDLLAAGGTAVINADDARAEQLEAICSERGVRNFTYGHSGRDLRLISHEFSADGQALRLGVFGAEYEVVLPLAGRFQAMNALCALGLVLACGVEAASVVPAMARLRSVPGRLELVPGHPAGAAVYVDYAHKPGALEEVLTTLRNETRGKLVCVFGCGGDRDAGKREIMGAIAARLADAVIVTDDNPRSEDPASIRAAIMRGAPHAVEVAGRAAAIDQAISSLNSGDVLVIAGKGHEQGQIIGGRTEPFDDVEVAQDSIKRLKEKV